MVIWSQSALNILISLFQNILFAPNCYLFSYYKKQIPSFSTVAIRLIISIIQ